MIMIIISEIPRRLTGTAGQSVDNVPPIEDPSLMVEVWSLKGRNAIKSIPVASPHDAELILS